MNTENSKLELINKIKGGEAVGYVLLITGLIVTLVTLYFVGYNHNGDHAVKYWPGIIASLVIYLFTCLGFAVCILLASIAKAITGKQ